MPEDICESLRAASSGWVGDAPNGAMLKATRAFLTLAQTDTAVLREAAACMRNAEPGAAAWIAVACGTAVESGAPAEITGESVIELMRSWLPKFPQLVEETAESPAPTPKLTPEQRALLPLFRYLCQAAVTHLARLPALREASGRDAALLDRLGELQSLSHGAVWVREALLKSSGTLVFLHPASGVGLQIAYTHVSNCFHLFSLMQAVIGTQVPGGREPDPAIARVARGKSTDAVTDQAWWHYGNALSNKAGTATLIPGESTVRDIPRVDGVPVIIAWPPTPAARTWDGAFLGPHLDAMPADVSIESTLSAEKAEAWLRRLKISRNRPWWKFRA